MKTKTIIVIKPGSKWRSSSPDHHFGNIRVERVAGNRVHINFKGKDIALPRSYFGHAEFYLPLALPARAAQ
jgi:hypothetical protein